MLLSKIKLAKLFNSRSGEDGYIIANGPSLKNENLEILKDKRNCISINASPLLEDSYGYNSEFYCLTDPRFFLIDEKRDIAINKISKPGTLTLCRDILETSIPENLRKEVVYLPSLGRDGFSKNLLRGFFFGSSTTMLALQLAYWLGLKNVYLLGLDLDYLSARYCRFYDEKEIQENDLLVSVQLHNFELANKVFEMDGRKLFVTNPQSWARLYIQHRKLQ